MYVTASKDGAVRLWDGITANCVRSITAAHGAAEATSAIFTKDQRYKICFCANIGHSENHENDTVTSHYLLWKCDPSVDFEP